LKPGGCEPLTSFSLPGAFFYSVAIEKIITHPPKAAEYVTYYYQTGGMPQTRTKKTAHHMMHGNEIYTSVISTTRK
jgi:hypothetical protein